VSQMKNYGISIRLRKEPSDPWLRPKVVRIAFKGTLRQVKAKAQKLLHERGGTGWKAIAESDGETAYCTYN